MQNALNGLASLARCKVREDHIYTLIEHLFVTQVWELKNSPNHRHLKNHCFL